MGAVKRSGNSWGNLIFGYDFKDNKCLTKLTCGSNNVLSLFYHYTKYETSATDSTITETGGDNFYVVKHKPNSGSYVTII